MPLLTPTDLTDVVRTIVADHLAAYRFSTPALEQALALLRSLYGGGPEQPHFRAMRRAEDEIAATLRVRARNLALTTGPLVAPPPPPPKPAPPDRGWKVRTIKPAPTQPPMGGAAIPALDLL